MTALVSRMREVFHAVATLFWVGLTPLLDELVEAGLIKSDTFPRSASVL
jgi:hypothetical protein